MQRILALLYGFAAYLTFLGTFLYAIGFVSGLVVPKTIDSGPATSLTAALIIDVVLMSIFALQHSIMARPAVQALVDAIRAEIDRAQHLTSCWRASRSCLLFWQWRPIPHVVWQVNDPNAAMTLIGVWKLVGWLIVLLEHLPDQPLRAVRFASGRQQPRWQADAGAALPHAAVLQICAPSDLSRLHHRVLGDADHDRRASVVRRGDHGLHLRRHRARRARPDRGVRRRNTAITAGRCA